MSILSYTTPAFIILMLLEIIYDWRKGTGYYRLNDTVGSLATGVLSQTNRLIVFSLGLWAMSGLNGSLIPLWSEESILTWVFAFIIYDCSYYWKHRFSHEINFLWAGHVVHHQSEEYNLSTALRQPSTHIMGWLFSIPLLLIGIPWQVVVVCAAWNLVYQFWVHTRHIKRLPGWVEAIMVTPAHHRVHHAQNPEYIDKNHGGVFIIWDKIFGTFQEELDTVPAIYGVRRPLLSFNPFFANFQLWWQMLQDAINTQSWKDKLRVWFMPTGWRPLDVEHTHPIKKYPLESFQKYNPSSPLWMKLYAGLHISLAALSTLYLAMSAESFSLLQLYLLWGLMSAPLLTVTSMLDNQDIRWETLRLVLSWFCLVYFSQYFDSALWWVALSSQVIMSVTIIWALWPKKLAQA
ncbi:sterol desaturase family protein [uncultured Pseudoteredinibacter sp.]|uniref:sterol desaturase family protein n=1 Tax=uncultured Pseudoteredinibacter sp. TaxID=1641701 RepID=UPI00261FC5C7|nr:sterol desaturase family protein [uncultured Pseudoteredinibacter sp.]